MRATPLTVAIALIAKQALAADALTSDEIAKLQYMTALAYAEAIDAYCLRDWHYASTALAAAATTQADLQGKSHSGVEQTHEASRLKADLSACEPARAFVDKVTATIPEMQPRMDATLTVIKDERAEREAIQARGERIAQCGEVVAVAKTFLTARWSLANGGYEEELPRCIADLAAMPEAGALLAEAKSLLPEIAERIKVQSEEAHKVPEQTETDSNAIIADWCAKQSEKTALCGEGAK